MLKSRVPFLAEMEKKKCISLSFLHHMCVFWGCFPRCESSQGSIDLGMHSDKAPVCSQSEALLPQPLACNANGGKRLTVPLLQPHSTFSSPFHHGQLHVCQHGRPPIPPTLPPNVDDPRHCMTLTHWQFLKLSLCVCNVIMFAGVYDKKPGMWCHSS